MAIQQQKIGTERQHNRILDALPVVDRVRWMLNLESVELNSDQLLCEMNSEYLYFPTTAIVSMLYVTESGASTEIAVIGNDGVVGMSMFMNGNTQPIQAKVQNAGHAYRVRGHFAKEDAHRGGVMLDILSRYAQAMNAQVAQTAVCNRHHSIDQQLCRRLLTGLDLSQAPELLMSHQLAASLLGVRRESVTLAARRLQDAGMIRYSRGHIAVLDRKLLEKRACECYEALQREYDRLLPREAPTTACATSFALRPRTVVTRRAAPDPSLLLCRI